MKLLLVRPLLLGDPSNSCTVIVLKAFGKINMSSCYNPPLQFKKKLLATTNIIIFHFLFLQVTNVSIPKYIVSSTIGLLPTQALNAYMGSTFRSLEDVVQEQSGGYIILFIQFIISILLMTYVIRRARKELNRTCDEMEPDVLANGHVVTALPEQLQRVTLEKNSVMDIDVEAQLEEKEFLESKMKKGHKRSKSASAVLIAVNEISKGAQTP